jgi:hypothetical protein
MHPNPARLIFRARGTLIEQRALWLLLLRALHVTDLPSGLSQDVKVVRDIGDGFGRSRNEIIYGNAEWLYDEDAAGPSGPFAINDDAHSYPSFDQFFVDYRDSNFAFARLLIRILLSLVQDVETQSGVRVLKTTYGPCLLQFAGFQHAAIEQLYTSLYRRESFGIDL